MNVDIQFSPNEIIIWNYELMDIELEGIYIDIETNLITHINTLYIPPAGGYVSMPLSNYFFQHCKGFKVELYKGSELVLSKSHIYDNNLNSRYYIGQAVDLVDNTVVYVTKIGFEQEKELSFFKLACPHLI